MPTAQVQAELNNPANDPYIERMRRERGERIAMSTATRKLEVTPIPGWHLHWVKDEPANMLKAHKGWYEFVDPKEVRMNNVNVANDKLASGNTDLGTRVSLVAGRDESGAPVRLFLMKVREDIFQTDQSRQAEGNSTRLQGIFGAEAILSADGKNTVSPDGMTYIDMKRTSLHGGDAEKPLFNRKVRKARPAYR